MTELSFGQQERLTERLMQTAVEAAEYNLVATLHPSITIDGDKWCVLYGQDLMTGIAGFGETPYLAVLDFNRNWHCKVGDQSPDCKNRSEADG